MTHRLLSKFDLDKDKLPALKQWQQFVQQIEKNQQSGKVLSDLLQLSLEEASLDELLQRALDLILDTPWLSVKAQGSIFLVEEDADVLKLRVHHDLAKPLLKKCAAVPFGHCLCGQAAANGKTLFTNCVDKRHAIRYPGMAQHGHYNVPIWLDERVIGIINLYVEHEHQQDEQELSFLEAVAKTLAIFIKRKQAEEKIAYQTKSLATINDIAQALYNSLDIESIVKQSVDAVQIFTKAPMVSFYERIEKGAADKHYLRLLSSRGMSAKTKKISQKLPLQGSLAGIAIAQKAFVASDDLVMDDRMEPKTAKALQKQGLKNMYSIPLLAQDRAVGVINFVYKETRIISTQEQETLLAIGNTIGLALANAQHMKQVETEIVERKKLEHEIQTSLAMRSRQVTISTHIAQEIAAAPNLHNLYQRVVTQVQEQFGYYHTQLLRHDVSMDILGLVVGYGDVGQKMLEMNHSMPVGVGLIGMAASTKQSALRQNAENEPNWQSNPLLPKTRSELAVPIKLRNEVLGVLDVQSDKVEGIATNDQLLLEGLCGQIAIAIESTELRQEMEGRLRELSLLQRQMSREGWHKYQQKRQELRGYQFGLAGLQPLTTNPESSSENGNNGTVPQVLPKHQVIHSLTVRGEAIGSFGVIDDPERPLTDEDREIINAVAEELAEALEAARLFEQTQIALAEQERLASELETVAQVSTAAATILDVNELLQAVVDLAKSSFSLYHAHIYLTNEAGNKLVLKAGAGNIGHLMSLEGGIINLDDKSIVARAARTRKGVLENNVRRTVDFLPHPLLPETRAEMALPMLVGGKLIGVLDLQSDKEGFFTEEDLNVQTTLAAQISVAVENANQYAVQVKTATKLRQVDQLKSEFLASMSHELRTPLNSIIGFADVLLEGLDGELNDRMEEDVQLIRSSGDHLRGLIGDILDMSKIEAGRMDLRYEEVDMAKMVNDVVATAAPLAQEKQIFLHLDIDRALKPIQADRTRLRQVIWNILGNAIKFTEKGSITVSVQAKENHLLCSVRDTGIGIKDEQAAVVFEQFRQIDGGLNRAAGGTGLGMPITRKLVELHGGEIWIESVYGQGSTFLFTIPYQPPKKMLKPVEVMVESS
jgi:signal transduction histidine kinase